MRRLFEILPVARKAHHHIRLSASIRSDLLWWYTFMTQWYGVSIISGQGYPSVELWTDAPSSFGCGAICLGLSKWLQLPWGYGTGKLVSQDETSIAWMELLPIVLATAVWGRAWCGWMVAVHCDNTTAVTVVNSGYSRMPRIMHLLRCLFFIRAHYQFTLQAQHIEGANNTWADAISRDNPVFMQSQVFRSTYQRTPLPQSLVELLVERQPDWTSVHWTQLVRDCLQLA